VEGVLAAVGWPVLDRVRIGDFAISPHGVMIAVGYLLGSMWLMRQSARRGISEAHASQVVFWALVGAIFGARFFYVVGHFSEFDGFVDMLAIWRGGISLIGGIVGATLFAYVIVRKNRYRFLQVADPAFMGVALGIAVGRIGDLIIGDHLGKPTSWLLAWTYEGGHLAPPYHCLPPVDPTVCTANLFGGRQIEFTEQGARMFDASGSLVAQGVGVHQTALYDLFIAGLLFLFLWWLSRRPRREGILFATFAIWYGTGRVVTDFLRVDKRFFGLTGSQWTTATVALVAVVLLVKWAIESRSRPPVGGEPRDEEEDRPTTTFSPPPEPGRGFSRGP
jgi:phosphatidylglycerol:prolipoprotein diacylglycerol transferase